MDTIQDILSFHKQEPLLRKIHFDNKIKEYKLRKNQIEPWFLACDNQEPEKLKDFLNKYGAITLNGKLLADFWNGKLYWNKAKNMEIEHIKNAKIVEIQYLKYLKIYFNDDILLKKEYNLWIKRLKTNNHQPRWWYEMSEIEYWRKEIVIFDMWMLKESKFFIGSWHSTLTRNVCHWRGYKNMFNSTNCYLVHKWRSLHDENYKPPNSNDPYSYNWFDINTLDKPKIKIKTRKR